MGVFIGVFYFNRRCFDIKIPDHPISVEDAVRGYFGLEDIAAESKADQKRIAKWRFDCDFIRIKDGRLYVDIENMRFGGPPYVREEEEPEEEEPEVITTVTVDITDKEEEELLELYRNIEIGHHRTCFLEAKASHQRKLDAIGKVLNEIWKQRRGCTFPPDYTQRKGDGVQKDV
jgi:hypothetical protein